MFYLASPGRDVSVTLAVISFPLTASPAKHGPCRSRLQPDRDMDVRVGPTELGRPELYGTGYSSAPWASSQSCPSPPNALEKPRPRPPRHPVQCPPLKSNIASSASQASGYLFQSYVPLPSSRDAWMANRVATPARMHVFWERQVVCAYSLTNSR